jgi:hypothetical protein
MFLSETGTRGASNIYYLHGMNRKRWTAKTEVDDALLKFREKRKWQLALRRYILERKANPQYAPYFGLGIEEYRKWIELQFTQELNWSNFGKEWQFDHIVPVAYFDYSIEEDLKLCWSFINIRVEKLDLNKARGNRVDVLSVKTYFEKLYETTGYSLCSKMIHKIEVIEVSAIISEPLIENFIIENKSYLEMISKLSHDEFNSLNMGMTLNDILLQREILKKFG